MLPLLIMRAGLGACFTNFQPRVNTVTEFNFTVAPTQFDIMLPEICTVFTDMVLLIHILTSFFDRFHNDNSPFPFRGKKNRWNAVDRLIIKKEKINPLCRKTRRTVPHKEEKRNRRGDGYPLFVLRPFYLSKIFRTVNNILILITGIMLVSAQPFVSVAVDFNK